MLKTSTRHGARPFAKFATGAALAGPVSLAVLAVVLLAGMIRAGAVTASPRGHGAAQCLAVTGIHAVAWFHKVTIAGSPETVKRFPARVPPAYREVWRVEGAELVQKSVTQDVRIFFGDSAWKDYDFTVEAKRVGGGDCFSLVFRHTSDGICLGTLGAAGNTWAGVEVFRTGAKDSHAATRLFKDWPEFRGGLVNDRWYTARVRVRGDKGELFLDGKKAFDFKADQLTRGELGLRTWHSAYRFRNIKVTTPDGKVLLEGVPELVTPKDVREARRLEGFGWPVADLAFFPGLNRLLTAESGTGKTSMAIWDTVKGNRVIGFARHPGGASELAIAPGGKLVASRGRTPKGGEVAVWRGDTQAVAFRVPNVNGLHTMRFAPDGKRLLLLTNLTEDVRALDLRNGKVVARMSATRPSKRPPGTDPVPDFSLDTRRVVLVEQNGEVRVWDMTTGKDLAHIKPGHRANVHAVRFLPDGKHVLTAGADGKVRVWEWEGGTEVRYLDEHTKPVRHLACSPDGKWVVTGDAEGTIIVWAARTWSPVHRCIGHTAQIRALAISSDSKLVASSSDDRTVRLWQLPK